MRLEGNYIHVLITIYVMNRNRELSQTSTAPAGFLFNYSVRCPSAFVIWWNHTTQGLGSGIARRRQRGQMTQPRSSMEETPCCVNFDHWESRDGKKPVTLISSHFSLPRLFWGVVSSWSPSGYSALAWQQQHLSGDHQCLLAAHGVAEASVETWITAHCFATYYFLSFSGLYCICVILPSPLTA
jgi:hypothetical protein